jgi:hypothetical protein
MPDTGGPNTSGEDTSHGEVRCDVCETKVIVDAEQSSEETRAAIAKHFKETGHNKYSFYGRTLMEAGA